MFNHPWCVLLLSITQVIKDVEHDQNNLAPWAEESIDINDLIRVRDALEQICDISFK